MDGYVNKLVASYFSLGLQQLEILACLEKVHSIHMSERSLRRRLMKLELHRRKHFTDVYSVAAFLEEQLNKSSGLHGYKWMHLKCLQNNFVVTQNTIRQLLSILDPDGVNLRKRRRLRRRRYMNRGPNFMWHMDCYDKLKHYGICISGCIDGFSRHIMWLKAGKNSNNPKVIAGYYTKLVESIGGVPLKLRADMGTENRYVEQMQVFFRRKPSIYDLNGNQVPFLYGTSQANQRIESWWAILRNHNAQFWIELFHKLKEDGEFNGSYLDKALVQFCFLNIIQRELDTVSVEWNTHRISNSKNGPPIRGKPLIMYHIPEVYNHADYLCKVPLEEVAMCKRECIFLDEQLPCDEDVYNLALLIKGEYDLDEPRDADEAVALYKILRNEMYEQL